MRKIIITEIDINDDSVISKVEIFDSKKDDTPNVSRYAQYFGMESQYWSKDLEWNLLYLKQTQAIATDMLRSRGHLFLNEVYDMLGVPRTKIGAVVGWIFRENNPIGDNYVDFGIFETRNRGFIKGYDKSILLDFNVDGFILDKI